jgi:SMC interacting uncharacterized protein involved in chromosome segregation
MTLAMKDTKAKITIVITHMMEEIVKKEEEIAAAIQTVKDNLQKLTEAWRNTTQQP